MDEVEAFSKLPYPDSSPASSSYVAISEIAQDLYDGFQEASEMFVTYTIQVGAAGGATRQHGLRGGGATGWGGGAYCEGRTLRA